MLANFSRFLAQLAKGWVILLAFAVMALCMAVLLPGAEAAIKATGASGPIDLMFFPLPAQSYAVVEALGQAGRASYRLTELSVDLIYPLAYTLFYSLLMTALLQRALDKSSRWQLLNLLPFGALVFDLLENIGIVSMLSMYPLQPAALGIYTLVVNGIKWVFAGASSAALLVSLGIFLWRKLRK